MEPATKSIRQPRLDNRARIGRIGRRDEVIRTAAKPYWNAAFGDRDKVEHAVGTMRPNAVDQKLGVTADPILGISSTITAAVGDCRTIFVPTERTGLAGVALIVLLPSDAGSLPLLTLRGRRAESSADIATQWHLL
jgi:hypothetical protein